MSKPLELHPLYDPVVQSWSGQKTAQDLKDMVEYARPTVHIADNVTIGVDSNKLHVKPGGIGSIHIANGAIGTQHLNASLNSALQYILNRQAIVSNAVVSHTGWTSTSGNINYIKDFDPATYFEGTQQVGTGVPGWVTSEININFQQQYTGLVILRTEITWNVPAMTSAHYYLEFIEPNTSVVWDRWFNWWGYQYTDEMVQFIFYFSGSALKILFKSQGTSSRTFKLKLFDVYLY